VYGSELIRVKFDPTGFPGCVTVVVVGDDDPEHPANASVRPKMAHTAHP
jgi:hypothetical protein